MKIFYIPIEPYETRYTADWIEQFEKEFKNNNIEFETILGEKTTTQLKEGTVLDSCGTNIYKASQIIKLLKLINDGKITDDDIIFFADIWFPGIESLFYCKNNDNLKFKIYGILHAGTYDEYDFTYRNGMRPWGQYLEKCILQGADKIFVATEFHKNLILISYPRYTNKIAVTGIPFYAKELNEKYKVDKKEKIVVFPHRNAPEKQPELFDELAKLYPQYTFIKTLDVCKNRDDYFKLLAKSSIMVSFAKQETFGYSTVEAMALNNYVIVPDKLSYKETVPKEYRYNAHTDKQHILENVCKLLDKYDDGKIYKYDLEKWRYSIKNMINEIRRDKNEI